MVMIKENLSKLITLSLAPMLIMILVFPSLSSAFAGFGGYISEKMLGDGTNEAFYLGDGTNELTVLGSGSVISTVSASSTSEGGVISATLTGNLANLNGMPRADVWFEWGYTPATLTNLTTTVSTTTLGNKTATITPLVGEVVYYRFVAGTDGTSRGSTLHFVAGGGHGVAYWLLNTLLPIVVAAVILIGVLLLTGNPIAAFGSALIGLIGFYIVKILAELF